MNIYEVLNPLVFVVRYPSCLYAFKAGYCQCDSDLDLERWSKSHYPIIIGKDMFPSIAETTDFLGSGHV